MIYSMTGYGKGRFEDENIKVVVELRGVNSRFYDISVKGIRRYLFLEEEIKKLIKSGVRRGKIDVSVSITAEDAGAKVVLNSPLAKEYIEKFQELKEIYPFEDAITLSKVIRMPEVLTLEADQEDDEKFLEPVKLAAQDALKNFIEMRTVEGSNLGKDIMEKLEVIAEATEKIAELMPTVIKDSYEKKKARMTEILEELSEYTEEKLLYEAGSYAEKIAVDEEVTRLRSHVEQMKNILENKSLVEGKKLDFISQEINREANTIGSKAGNLEVTNLVVTIKGENEKIREQVQNIE